MSQVAKIEQHEAPTPAVQSHDAATAFIAMIERAARDPNVDIDKMERLLQMQERVMARQAKASFDGAMARMQPELPVVNRKGRIVVRAKGATGQRDGEVQQDTPYALFEDINEAIRPKLSEHGFAMSFRTGLAQDGKISVTGILSHRDGHREETTIILPHDSTGSKNAVQAVGSSTSYGKRYVLCALLNISTRGEDDDGKAGGAPATISEEDQTTLRDIITVSGANELKFLNYMTKLCKREIGSLADIPAAHYDAARSALENFSKKAGR